MIKRICTYILLINIPLSCGAAQQTEKLWSWLTLAGDYGKVVYYLEPQLRLVNQGNSFQQFLTNSGLGYKIVPDWQIWFGQTVSTDSQDAVPGDLDEYRLWQQMSWKRRLSFISLYSRTRFEERKSLFFSDWAYRLRQRLMLNKPVSSNLSVIISDEIFLNVNSPNWIITKRLDQNRTYLGLEQRITAKTYLGVGYMNQYLSTSIAQYNNVLWVNWRIDLEKNA